MKITSSFALAAPFLLGAILVVALTAKPELSPQTTSTADLIWDERPNLPSTGSSPKTLSREDQKNHHPLSSIRKFSASSGNSLINAQEAKLIALQDLSLPEVVQKFEEAIGPTLSRTLPKDRRAQIFQRFRERLATPLEPSSYICWSEHTPANVTEASHRAELFANALIESEVSSQAFQSTGSGRWSSTASGSTGAYGTPITLTWSIVPDGSLTDDSEASNLIERLATIYASEGANTLDPPANQPWFQYFTTAMNNLSEETGIIFIYEPNDDGAAMSTFNDGILNLRGDLRIFGAPIDGDFNTLAYNYSPGYGDMVIDTNDSYFTNKSNSSIRLRNTLGHEVGHGLGLGHVCPRDSTKLMEPQISTNFSGAQFDDVLSLQRRYGDHLERSGGAINNDNILNAGTLTLTPNSPYTVPERLSIDDNSDVDVYKISASSGQSIVVTITPTDESYLEGGQDANGSCTGNWVNYDFSSYHNLAVEIRAANGALLTSSNQQGLGVAENISYPIPSSGDYYIRVLGDSTDETQIYSLTATLLTPSTTISLAATDTTIDEGNNTNTASFVVNSTSPLNSALTVTLIPGGSASASDYSGALTATIPAGQLSSNTLTITAAQDSLIEGNETLILSLPSYLSGPEPYDLGNPSSLSITILDTLAPTLEFSSSSITAESFSEQNGYPDPNETLEVLITLENQGPGNASNVTGTLTAASGMVPFDTVKNFGSIPVSGTANASFQFGLTGTCGETVNLNLAVNSSEGNTLNVPLSYTMGVPGAPTTEDMEHAGSFPPNWTSSTTGVGIDWQPASAQSSSGTYSLFAFNTASLGSSTLTSPSIALPSPAGSISFTHIYATEAGWDGCVLEISINGGAWQDIISAGGTFTTNGYNDVLTNTSNPLGGRNAWSGSSGGFITTSVDLPPAAAGLPVQFRWIIGSDSSSSVLGWYIDDIVTPGDPTCDTSGPQLVLSLSGEIISEANPGQTAILSVATNPLLPVVTPIPLSLSNTGSADALADVTGLSSPSIPTGASSFIANITAINDGLIEGNEALNLSFTSIPGSAAISVLDTPYAIWALGDIGSTGNVGPTQDFDLDGSSNIEEYAFQTLAGDPNNYPSLSSSKSATNFKLLAPPKPWPADLEITGKTSTDLLMWTETGVTETTDGFEIPLGHDQRFLRMFYSLTPMTE